MSFTIFWSWQSDTRAACNRTLIGDAINQAVDRIRSSRPSLNVTIYESTEGVSGLPSITDTILERIKTSNVFIADLTLTGTISNSEGVKKTPNPNVLLELGFAAANLGWNNIISVMNTYFGVPEELPFDLRYRRYGVNYNSDPLDSDRSIIRNTLSQNIERSVLSTVDHQEQQISNLVRKFDKNCLTLLHNHANDDYFSSPNEVPGNIDDQNNLLLYQYGITRLLDLGLIWTEFNQERRQYAYYWTYMGTLILERFFDRNS